MRSFRFLTIACIGALVPACPRDLPPQSWFEPTAKPADVPPSSATPVKGLSGPFVSCEKTPVNELIRVDQFGYRPAAKKVAVLADPVKGWNEQQELKPGARYEVRNWQDGSLAFSGAPAVWNGGATDASSGDRGSWFDFSALSREGDYCVLDSQGGFRSHRFSIGPAVYRDVLRAALRAFYFQRANVAKDKPSACVGQKCWTGGADYVGSRQDKEARSVKDRGNAATARDLSGGWWDAGDTNKYVTFAQSPVHQLLSAYADRPQAFGDDFGIPESGNGVPDILDELKVELTWLTKMQPANLNGGVLIKVGNIEFGDPVPEKSRFQRYYYPEPCSSSTIAAAGMFAHAALVLRGVPALKGFADDLKQRAVRAWTHFHQHSRSADCDDLTIKAGDADRDLNAQEQAATVAAIYLFALTAEEPYALAVAKGFRGTRPMQEDRWSSYDPEQGDALLFYAELPNADAAIKAAIVERKLTQARQSDIYSSKPELDLYRAFMRPDAYHWGHNMVRANVGNTNYDLVTHARLLQLSAADTAAYANRAEALLQSFHGVNAMGLVYLTNMYPYGAESSVNQMFHVAFRDGDPSYDDARSSRLGPAPGYVPGGPNRQYCEGQDAKQNRCATSRLRQQPPQKAYLDFNTAWEPNVEHDRSWELTEPANTYQASYVALVSKFVP